MPLPSILGGFETRQKHFWSQEKNQKIFFSGKIGFFSGKIGFFQEKSVFFQKKSGFIGNYRDFSEKSTIFRRNFFK